MGSGIVVDKCIDEWIKLKPGDVGYQEGYDSYKMPPIYHRKCPPERNPSEWDAVKRDYTNYMKSAMNAKGVNFVLYGIHNVSHDYFKTSEIKRIVKHLEAGESALAQDVLDSTKLTSMDLETLLYRFKNFEKIPPPEGIIAKIVELIRGIYF